MKKMDIFKQKLKALTLPPIDIAASMFVPYTCYRELSRTPIPPYLKVPVDLTYYQPIVDLKKPDELITTGQLNEKETVDLSTWYDSGDDGEFFEPHRVPSLNILETLSQHKLTDDSKKLDKLAEPPELKKSISSDLEEYSDYCSEFSGQTTTPRHRYRKKI